MGQQADNTSLRRDSCGRVVVTALAAAVRRWLVRPLRWLPASRFVQPCRQRATLQVEGLELRALLDATVVISEIVASNRHGLLDYDDARSDWLELFNPRTESVDLSGYSLSDDAGDLQKWGFPQDTVLDAGQRLVIFASGKDGVLPNGEIHTNFKLASGGEPLMLVEPDGETVVWQFDTTTGGVPGFPSQREDIAYGPAPTETPTTLVGSDADVAYLVPTSADAIDGDWMTNGFADPQGVWTSAPMGNGVGYDAGGPADELPSDVSFNSLIRTDVMGEMRGSNASVFVRSEFTVASPHMLDEPMLRVRYDDGFVAYLNGQQIARRSAPVDPAWNATATDRRDDAAAIRYEEIPLAAGARLRDFNGTADGIFVVDVPNGSYRVKVFLGDLVKRREQMAVLIEGDQREVLDTEASQFAVREYRADVVDGQLTLRLEKQGGPTTNVVISALEVVSETPDGPHWRFDFGTFDSPVFPGYQQVTPASTYTVSSGYGWLGGRILANDRSPSLAPADLLLAGRNVLAIQGLNVSATDDDALLQVELTAFQQGVDATRFEFFAVPTPGQPNAQGRLAVAEAPQFSSQGGTFVEPFSVTLSTDVPGGMIHYTLDETLPTLDGPVYDPDVPLEITGTTQVRAIVAATGYVTSPVVTETYVRLGDDLVDFTSPIPILVLDSLDVAPFPTRPFPINAFQSSYWAIFEPQGEQRQSSLNQPPDFQTRVGAQMRGNSSAGFPRKSFRLEAWDQYDRDLDVSPLGLPADADWILNARSEFDRSLMNNAFMYALSNESGLPAVRTRFVEVFVNMDQGELTSDDYLGVYALMEKVKRGEQRVAVEKLSKNYRTEPLVTGGYIVNLELEAQYREFGFAAGGRDRFQYVEPSADEMLEPIREPQVNYIKNYMERVAASLDNPDPKTGYPSLIDVDNWIDYHLLSTFARNSDSLDHSTYMSKARNGKLKHGPLWDYDRALGARRQETQRKPFEGWQQRDFTMEWWVTLFEQADFRQAYADRYQEFRDGPWSDVNLNGLIDRLAGEITSEAAARNYQRWPHPLAGDPPNWLGEVEELRRWVLGRVHWMDEQFLARPIVVVDGEEVAGDRPLSEDAIVTLQLSESAPVGAQIYYTL
ncbi:MAG: CotH kinase family protein, partial [Pirellulales bacterium]